MSASDNPFEKIDAAMNLYYRAMGRYDFYDDDKTGKFVEFCDDNGLDVDDIDEELDDPTNCMYIEFDDDFPFVDKEKDLDADEKNSIIFQIIKSCYQTGLPPDKYRPRKKNLTRPQKTSLLVDAYLRDIASQYKPAVHTPVVINELCTKFQLQSYNLMAPYDFNYNLPIETVIKCETVFSNLYMYHSKLPNKADYESLAVGYANKHFPWLLYVLESFDRDRIRRGCAPEVKELSLKEWMVECDFLNEYLLQELGGKDLFASIEKVCIFYIRKWKNQMRVMPSRMEMERMYIQDDLYEITEVVLAIYKFVKWLVSQYKNTKFQCEFAIAIHSTEKEILTTAMVPDMNNKEAAAAAKKEEEDKFSHQDIIGDFLLNMRENKIAFAHRKVRDRSKMDDDLRDAWSQFAESIEANCFEERPSTFGDMKTEEEKEKYYRPFPKQRRFCCFVDRRQYFNKTSFHKQLRPMMMMGGRMGGGRHMHREEMMGFGGMMGGLLGGMGMYEWVRTDVKNYRNMDVDEFTLFIPEDQYLPIDDGDEKNGIYPESYFDILHTSMIPELRIFDDEKEDKHLVSDRISGIASLNASMFNLLFQIDRFDEIRMYVHWHNQCIRLHPQDFWLVLPRIFVNSYKNNAKYATDVRIRKKILDTMQMPDKYFEYFYKYLSVYSQQKKEWIDKPTEIKFVN